MKVKIECELEIDDNSLSLNEDERKEDIEREIKFAIQRVQRKYDDSVSWSVDYYLNEIMPPILRQLKDAKGGTPCSFFPDNYGRSNNYDKQIEEKAQADWNAELDKMIAAFEIAKKIEDEWIFDKNAFEYKIFEDGMQSFVKHYFSLWD